MFIQTAMKCQKCVKRYLTDGWNKFRPLVLVSLAGTVGFDTSLHAYIFTQIAFLVKIDVEYHNIEPENVMVVLCPYSGW